MVYWMPHPPTVNPTVRILGIESLGRKRLGHRYSRHPERLGTRNLFKPRYETDECVSSRGWEYGKLGECLPSMH